MKYETEENRLHFELSRIRGIFQGSNFVHMQTMLQYLRSTAPSLMRLGLGSQMFFSSPHA